jgi:hypothetical protein
MLTCEHAGIYKKSNKSTIPRYAGDLLVFTKLPSYKLQAANIFYYFITKNNYFMPYSSCSLFCTLLYLYANITINEREKYFQNTYLSINIVSNENEK